MINLKEFKQSVLQKAMQGELTKQLPSDGNAKDLLVKIANKKRDLVQAGKLKYHKPLPPVTSKEIPFDIPNNWEWVRLPTLLKFNKEAIRRGPFGSSIKKSMFVPKSENTYKVYEQGNAINQSINYGHYYITPNRYNKLRHFKVHTGDIIVSCAGTIGRTYVLPDNCPKGVINQALIRISLNRHIIDTTFFLLLFRQRLGVVQSQSIGSAIKNMASVNTLKRKLVWQLPPLPEQKRIVTKVHKCFEFADTIQKERELNKKFAHDMKQSLLTEAMQGKLTKQLPSDGTADELLKQIKQKKQELIKAGKIKKHKPLSAITKDEVPFKIPKNWKWVRLNDIGSWKSGSTPKRSNKSYYDGNIPWLKTGDLNDGYIKYTSEHISKLALKDAPLRVNPKGSVLIAMYGATISRLGILKINATTNQACCACIPYLINNEFLFYYLMSQRNNLIALGAGGAQPNISRTKIIHYLIPLPPLLEQKRIVIRLKSIFSLLSIY